MGLLGRLKSMLGRGSGRQRQAGQAAEITIEQASEDRERPVDGIDGIGPAYAARLAEAGVETVSDLQTSDPNDLAEKTDIEVGRIENWLERADTDCTTPQER